MSRDAGDVRPQVTGTAEPCEPSVLRLLRLAIVVAERRELTAEKTAVGGRR
jgi:hypothetical protein